MMIDPALDAGAYFFSVKQTARALSIGCALIWWGVCSTVLAQYRFDVINTDNGLPQNTVGTILQTRDGYLWFSTFDGLVRYNGAQFTVFNKANTKGIQSNRFMSLFEDRDGTLWAATEDGGLTRYHHQTFVTYTTADGLPHNQVAGLRQAPDGTLLVSTVAGLARWQDGKFITISTDNKSFESELGTQSQSGAMWYRIGTELRRVKDGKTKTYQVPAGGRWQVMMNQLYEDREGRLWIGTWKEGSGQVCMLKDDLLTCYGPQDGYSAGRAISIYQDRKGVVWFATENGLACFKDGRFTTYTTDQGLPTKFIHAVFEDREGTLWIGTRDKGIMRMTPRVVTTLSEKDGLVGKIFYPLIEDRTGAVWVANRGANRIKDGHSTYYPLNLSPPYRDDPKDIPQISAFYEDRQGRLWIGHGFGLYRFENEQLTYDRQMTTQNEIYAIYQDTGGAFWFGFSGALIRYQDGVAKKFDSRDGLQGFVQPIYEDRKGRIWIGGYSGLIQYVDGRLVFLTEKDGLSSNRIRAIYEDADGVLWIGTYDGGLNRYKDGRFTRYTTKEGMFSDGVFAILEDAHGNFWMSSNQGIHRVSKQQLNDFAEGKIAKINSVAYGKADGMLNTECNGARQPAGIKTRDGRLWFPTFEGVAVVNPEAVTFNSVPPPIVIEKVILDREEMSTHLPLEVRPGQDNLEIQYAGLSFIKPESMEFKYRLEGLDQDWVDAGNRRVAYYPHLSPGSYTFRVIAANSDGVWNESGAELKVTVIPPFYRTWWFTLLVALSVVGLAVLFYQVQVNQLRRTQAQQEAFSRRLIESQETERRRIASELHDSLGQSLVIIRNWALLGAGQLAEQSPAREELDEINTTASRAINEVREIAYNLGPYHLDRLGLAGTIEDMVKRVAQASRIRFTTELEPLNGALSRETEMNLYRMAQETINNLVKHAEASEARVTLKHEAGRVKLTVTDNGKGFDPNQTTSVGKGGFGLTGMAERVRLLKGICEIHSAPGQGTKIEITIGEEG